MLANLSGFFLLLFSFCGPSAAHLGSNRPLIVRFLRSFLQTLKFVPGGSMERLKSIKCTNEWCILYQGGSLETKAQLGHALILCELHPANPPVCPQYGSLLEFQSSSGHHVGIDQPRDSRPCALKSAEPCLQVYIYIYICVYRFGLA